MSLTELVAKCMFHPMNVEDEKILLFDVETTGLDPVKNGIITLSGAIIINGEVRNWFDFKCRPLATDDISPEALEVNGLTVDEIMAWQEPKEMLRQFHGLLEDYVRPRDNKHNNRNRFTPMAYNAMFDVNFLSECYKKSGFRPVASKKYDILGSVLNRGLTQDVHKVVTVLEFLCPELNLKSHKLSTVAEALGIPINAHEGISDCRATWELWKWSMQRLADIGHQMTVEPSRLLWFK